MNQPVLYDLQTVDLDLSEIIIGQQQHNFPFDVQRFYFIRNRNNGASTHGPHALKESEQLFIAIRGAASVQLIDRTGSKSSYKLEDHTQALYVPKMYWRTVILSSDGILLSLSSTAYQADDYIHDLEEFLASNA